MITRTELDSMYNSIIDRLDEINRKISTPQAVDLPADETLISGNHVCQMLNISIRTLRRYREKKLITGIQIERRMFYRIGAVRELVRQFNAISNN